MHAILTFFVSPSVNDPPFSSISAENHGLTSLRSVTQLRSTLRVMGREHISSETTVNGEKERRREKEKERKEKVRGSKRR